MILFNIMAKLRNMLLRGKIVRPQEDGNAVYTIQTQALNQTYLSEVYYPYGYGASPPVNGGLSINLALSAQSENMVSLPYAPTTRWKELREGEVQIGNQLLNTFIKFDAAGNIIINGNVTVEGNLTTTGDISDAGGSLQAFRNAYNAHTHIDSEGGTTSGPSIPA